MHNIKRRTINKNSRKKNFLLDKNYNYNYNNIIIIKLHNFFLNYKHDKKKVKIKY